MVGGGGNYQRILYFGFYEAYVSYYVGLLIFIMFESWRPIMFKL